MPTASFRALIAEAMDYAGVFPPSSLDMHSAVRKYARYRSEPQSWALARFVVPASRLDEFQRAQQQVNSEAAGGGRWRLSAVLSSDLAAELAAIQAFHSHESAVIDCIEARVSQPEEMSCIARHLPAEARLFCEIAPERAADLLPCIRRGGYGAKLRMGGTVPEAFPCVDTIACFLAQCAEWGLPLKVTAGLHHPLRRVAPLTYEPNSAKATMHGFLNLFTAAAIAWQDRQMNSAHDSEPALHCKLATCLYDTQREHWQFTDDALTWSGAAAPLRFDCDALRQVRSNFAVSFGTCSFEEPLFELSALDFLK